MTEPTAELVQLKTLRVRTLFINSEGVSSGYADSCNGFGMITEGDAVVVPYPVRSVVAGIELCS